MRFRSAFFVLSCFSYAIAQCGGTTTDIGDGGSDATVDTSPGNDSGGPDVANNETGTSDTGTIDTGTDASDGGATQDTGIGTWTCGSATVTDCSQCIGFTQACVFCNVADASVLNGACTQIHTNCFNAIPNNQFQDCTCSDAGPACPESDQVCIGFGGFGGRCHTCGDQNATDGLKCENGGTCDAVDSGCL